MYMRSWIDIRRPFLDVLFDIHEEMGRCCVDIQIWILGGRESLHMHFRVWYPGDQGEVMSYDRCSQEVK